jgi:centromere protein S
MSASETDRQVLLEKLKSALWFQVGKIVDEETLKLGVNATPQFIGSLTELVWAQIGELCHQQADIIVVLTEANCLQ